MPLKPITRTENFLARAAGDAAQKLKPITRKEQFYARIAGDDGEVLEPITRTEHFLQRIIDAGGGGGDITVEALTVTENKTFTAPEGKAYNPVTVNVPNSYTAGDEGKVVSSGALVSQTSMTVTYNGTYDTTLKNSVTVAISSRIQMRGDYYLADATGISSGAVDVQNYKSDAKFYCTLKKTDTGNVLLTIDFAGKKVETGSFNAGTGDGALKKITSSDPDFVLDITLGNYCFRNQKELEEISCKTTASVISTTNNFSNCNSLKSINFLPNSCKMPLPLGSTAVLTDAGLVLLANGLYASGPQTVTLHATPKARCDTLMGTVAQVTVSGETYDLFTADANGTVSLANFITQTKGWTLA